MARAQGDRQAEAANLEVLAGLYQDAGDDLRALEFYSQAQAINSELGLLWETGRDLRGAALIYASLGDLELAGRNAAEASDIHREIGAPIEELEDVLILAELAHLEGRSTEVDRWMRRARGRRPMDAPSSRVVERSGCARCAHRGRSDGGTGRGRGGRSRAGAGGAGAARQRPGSQ
jgi:tetratricopeptide (TPR) repeat protein